MNLGVAGGAVGARHWWSVGLLVGFAVLTQLPDVTRPFGRDLPSTNGAFYGLQARNLLRTDLSSTLAGGVVNTGDLRGEELAHYMHHPPALVWLVAGSYAVCGESEWSARLVPILAYAGCVLLLFSICRRGFGDVATAAAAVLVFIALPVARRYGAHVDLHGPLTLMMVLGAVRAYQSLLSGRSSSTVPISCWLAAGLLVDWPLAYLPVLFLGHALFVRRDRGLALRLLIPGAVAAAVLTAVVLHAALARGGIEFLTEKLRVRTFHFADDRGNSFGIGGWLWRVGSHLVSLYSLPALLLAAVWFFTPDARRHPAAPLVWLLAVFGLVDILLGLQASYVHDVWSIFLWPALAIALARLGLVAAGGVRGGRWLKFGGGLALVALGFYSMTVAPERDWDEAYGFSCHGLGGAIAAATEAEEAVVVVGEGECTAALYYYADRVIAPFVFDLEGLELALGGGQFYGPLWFPVESTHTVGAVVFPEARAAAYPELWDALREAWVSEQIEGALLFRPPPDGPGD